jgi:ABC-type Fe3+-hydroxamate transport system substrate-binding protein
MSRPAHDDLGYAVSLADPPRRVVSLVPSLTETIALSAPGRLVGATDWCVHPVGLGVERVRGTKNPDLDRIHDLSPDLVVANEEENRRIDVEALRAKGIPVWVTDIRTVDGALESIERLLDLLDAPERSWLDDARAAWGGRAAYPPVRVTAVVAIWRRPWMWLGHDTYAGDLLRRLGVANALAGHAERYPRIAPADLPVHDLVVLPDEPYRFTAADGPEVFAGRPVALVDGQALTWYGPRMFGARTVLGQALGAARA